ncbi:MAG: hypothetical protein AMXMBFR58_37350 [Phycisphaerae bacterium]
MPNLNTLPVRLQVARETASMSQQELAVAIDVSRNTVSNYERGTTNPRRQTLRLWAMATDVDPHWLMTGEAPSPSGDGASVVRPKGFEPLTFWSGRSNVLTCDFRRAAGAAVSSPGQRVA